jgi:hypothetical protein
LLAREYHVPPSEWRLMTLRQIRDVYSRFDKDGNLMKGGKPVSACIVTYEDDFRRKYRGPPLRLSEPQIDRLWDAYLQHECAKVQDGVKYGILDRGGNVIDPHRVEEFNKYWIERWRELAPRVAGVQASVQAGVQASAQAGVK